MSILAEWQDKRMMRRLSAQAACGFYRGDLQEQVWVLDGN